MYLFSSRMTITQNVTISKHVQTHLQIYINTETAVLFVGDIKKIIN